jgi:hypothetical protein
MTNGAGPELAERIVERGREVVVERLRSAFAHQAATRGDADLDPERRERMVQEAATRAGEALWRRSLAQAVMEELGITLSAALIHPLLADLRELTDAGGHEPPALPQTPEPAEKRPHHLELAPDSEPQEPRPSERHQSYSAPVPTVADAQALRLSAVHLNGIETLYQGDDDLELRLSEAGLDVLKRSNGAAIGRLEWNEIETVALAAPRRGLRSRRRSRELHVSTGRGQAQFELPGLTDDELHEHLEPTLARLRGTGSPNSTRARAAAAETDGGGGSATAGSPAGAT